MSSYRDADLEKRSQEFEAAFANGDESWFNYFADNATIYTINATEPFRGRAAYQENFRYLLKEKRKVDVLKRDVQAMGDTAVVMELVEVTQSHIATLFRQSTIWRKEGNDWKIIHMHTASVGVPRATEVPRDPGSIKVLASRIATVSAQVGVAQ